MIVFILIFSISLCLYCLYLFWVYWIRHASIPTLKEKFPETGAFKFTASGQNMVLLIHGFSSTPLEMRELGNYLVKNGFTVRGMCLPGHATRPRDLENTDYHAWYSVVEKEYDTARMTYKNIYAVGFSVGALLALQLAAHKKMAGLALLAPALVMSSHYFPCRSPEKCIKTLSTFFPYVRKFQHFVNINDKQARKKHISYTEISSRASTHIFDLADEVRPLLHNITAPTILFHGMHDKVSAQNGTEEIYNTIPATQKELVWLELSNHVLPADYDKIYISKRITEFFQHISTNNIIQ